MFTELPTLSYEEQQQAVERIQELMANGMSSHKAIGMVAAKIRENRTCRYLPIMLEETE